MAFQMTETDYGTKIQLKSASKLTADFIDEEFRSEMESWWNRVLMDAYNFCPKDTGALADSIRIEEGIPDTSSYFGVAAIAEPASISDMTIVAGGTTINPKTGKIVDYAQAVHDGHLTRGRNFVAPEPFLTDAIEINMPELELAFQRLLQRADGMFSTGG